MGFYLYKGLKKPLVFFGLKDKYIYYAAGSGIGGLVGGAIFSSFIGFFGLGLGLVLGGLGIWMTFKTQDQKGLYSKTRNNNELYIFPKRLKLKRK